MDVLREILHALWQQDFSKLADPNFIWVISGILFTTLFLENVLLPASFLPGDSLLLLAGALIAKGVMGFLPTLIILTTAASLGCWLSYLQGRWLGDTSVVKRWLLQLPLQYRQRAHTLFVRHGLAALLVGRFLAFVRTLLPTLAGISGLNSIRFQLFYWLSGLLWGGSVVGFGFALSHIPLVKQYENQVMTALMILPIVLLLAGLVGTLILVWCKRKSTTE
ncbi:DedA family protein [Yersinia pestis]|uniref:DedA family protein n=1 Tax=Yersinia pestis TaxID=632 RepID=UPI000B417A46|nr:DedA family protein [Yersinia pestis]OVY76476.1 DedA family protein [Yersinia pestis subsp. microtus bv. Xilingolensis]